ncbi:MAG: c-type cytochrome [Elusimicrobiota bacterium]
MYRKLFLFLNFTLVAVLAYAVWRDMTPEWKKYQSAYYRMAADAMDKQAAAAKDPKQAQKLKKEADALRHSPLEIKQILTKMGGVDRCTTCHVAMDEYVNPAMTNDFAQNPYKAHPKVDGLDLNKIHNFQKYGCTVCHQGQGMATTVKDAHGYVDNWQKPLLTGSFTQAACARCHANFEHEKGMEVVALGKKLFYKHGCQGCHAINGAGQTVSVDLGHIADKPLERIAPYNFSLIRMNGKPLPEDQWTLQNWILGHLDNDPEAVVPNDPLAKYNPEPIAPSGMVNWTATDASGKRELSEKDAEAITAFLLSLTHDPIPHQYYVAGIGGAPDPEPHFKDALSHGKYVFQKYGCAGCHGLLGTKGRRNFNALGQGQADLSRYAKISGAQKIAEMAKGQEPTLTAVVGTYTRNELARKISEGVPETAVARYNPDGPMPPLYMPAWEEQGLKGKELDDLVTWLLSVGQKNESQGGF